MADPNALPIENIKIYQGATYEDEWVLEDDDGNLIDITDWEFEGEVRRAHDDAVVQATFVFLKANQTTDTGGLNIRITDTETSAIEVLGSDQCKDPENMYKYDIFGRDPNNGAGGKRWLLACGGAEIFAGISL